MDKNTKPKTTLKEIRRKMKKMTLAEKKQIKEDKKEEKQKEKASKQKQKITQRVKININIPSQKTSTPQIQNPLSSSNRDQINLLTSINEQLKKKDEPKKATENFNIPVKQQSSNAETQTPTAPNEIETQTEPTQTQPNNEPFIQTQPYKDVRFENIYEEPEFPEFNFPKQFSEKAIPKIPIIKEPTQQIITKPKDTSSQSLIEKVKIPSSFLEELSAKQKIIKPKTDEETIQMEENIKQQRGRPPDTEEMKNQKAKEKEERGLMKEEDEKPKLGRKPDTEEVKQRKAEERKIIDQKEKDRTEMENRRITEKAFRILLDNSQLEEQKDLLEAYNRGFLKDKGIKDKLKKLNFSADEIKRIYSKENK